MLNKYIALIGDEIIHGYTQIVQGKVILENILPVTSAWFILGRG
jgi:hypothetical protein